MLASQTRCPWFDPGGPITGTNSQHSPLACLCDYCLYCTLMSLDRGIGLLGYSDQILPDGPLPGRSQYRGPHWIYQKEVLLHQLLSPFHFHLSCLKSWPTLSVELGYSVCTKLHEFSTFSIHADPFILGIV